MIAFEVSLNGERLCTAAIGERGVLTTIVSWVNAKQEGGAAEGVANLHVGGLADETHVRWVDGFEKLKIGDTLAVHIIETETGDPPVEKGPSQGERDRKNGTREVVDRSLGNLRCSFCNASEQNVRKLIAGPTVNICDQCVAVCVNLIERNDISLDEHDRA